MNEKIRWRFPLNDGGTIQGFNDSGITTFKGAELYNNLAREICQNSLDAKASDKKNVIVKFDLKTLSKQQFTALSAFDDIIKACKKSGGTDDAKFNTFISNAEQLLAGNSIDMLIISDYNTIGLSGAKDNTSKKSTWTALTHSSGVTNKPSGGSGGSYGIGKSAPFACSALRTVFYNTLAIEDNISAFQGVARLITHYDENGNETQGDGYYQNATDKCPIFPEDKCPIRDVFIRQDKDFGTDVIIAGFKALDGWQTILAKAIIKNFFVAIYDGTLVVQIDSISINASTLPNMIAEYAEEESADLNNPKDMRIIKEFYDTLTMPDTIYKTTILEADDLWLYISKNDTYSKRIAQMRAIGMLVSTRRMNIIKRFSALVIATGNQLNQLLKDIEPPRHDEWDPKIVIENKDLHRKASKTCKKMKQWVDQTILGECMVDYQDEIDPDGMSQFLPLELEDSNAHNSATESENPDSQTIIKKTRKRSLKMRSARLQSVNNYGVADTDGSSRNKTTGGNTKNLVGTHASGGTDKIHIPKAKGKNTVDLSPKVLYQRIFPITHDFEIYKMIIELDEPSSKVHISARAIYDDGKNEKLLIKEFTWDSIRTIVNGFTIGPLTMKAKTKYILFLKLAVKERMLININVW